MAMRFSAVCAFCMMICLFLLVGCSTITHNSFDLTEGSFLQAEMNEVLSIYDTEENLLTTIEHYGAITQTDTGFVYSKISADSMMEYYQYEFASNVNELLGAINEWVYEASYDSFYYNNHVYLLVTTGDAYRFDKTENYLYDIDLIDNTMTATMLKDATSPYNSMTLKDNNLIIVTPGEEKCYISSYDINSKKITRIKEYFFDARIYIGETIRHISSDEHYVYLLRLYMESEANVHMYVDICDLKLAPLSSVDVTNAITETTLATEDKSNELRQLVSQFDVKNSFVYYENFSITRALFEIRGITSANANDIYTKQVIAASPGFFKAANSTPSDTLNIYYEAYQNKVFVLDANVRQIKEYDFFANNEAYYITYVTQNSEGDMLVWVDYNNPNTSETLSRKIYFIHISDLL